jgi:alkyl hydroperoxide reductase subunit D
MEAIIMSWVDQIKDSLPEYAKDIKLNLDAVVSRSSFDPDQVLYISIAAAFASGNAQLIGDLALNSTDAKERDAALAAGATMAQNNTWYPYLDMVEDESLKGLPAQLRMNAIASHGGTTKDKFEAYSLAASIIGKCHLCVKAHYAELKKEGYTVEQLRDIGRIASTINALSKIYSAEQYRIRWQPVG